MPISREDHDAANWSAVLATARDAIIGIDDTGRITLFNPTAEAMFGYAASEVLQRNVTVLMPAPYRDEHDGYLRAYRATGVAKAIGRIRSVEARRKSGEIFPIELSVSESQLGAEVLYTAIVRDITEKVRLDRELRSQRDFAEQVIGTAPVIILVLDTTGRIVRYNAFMEDLCGRSSESVVGCDWFTTFLPDHERTRMRGLFERAVQGLPVAPSVSAVSTADGSERLIEWHARLMRDAEGGPLGLLCSGQDVTEQRRAEAALRETERATQQRERLADIGAITAKVVHDLGNPLAALSMQTQLILRRAKRGDFHPREPVQQPAEQILATLQRLEVLVREFTDFAREQRLLLTEIGLGAFLREVGDLWRPLAAARSVDLEVERPAEEIRLRADVEKLKRVFDNLVKNAIEAIDRPPGKVILRAAILDVGKVRIVVEDSGSGIPQGLDAFRLFETTKPEGTGIGLAIAKQLVHAHGGTIAHRPRKPYGTLFEVQLPQQPAPATLDVPPD